MVGKIIKTLFPNAVFGADYVVGDDGTGPKIVYWNESKLGPQPTEADIVAEAARIAALSPEPWRVGKGTIMDRIEAGGKLPQVMAIFASQSAEDQFRWTNNPWFWSNNATLRALCAHPAIGLAADAVLAPDPYL